VATVRRPPSRRRARNVHRATPVRLSRHPAPPAPSQLRAEPDILGPQGRHRPTLSGRRPLGPPRYTDL